MRSMTMMCAAFASVLVIGCGSDDSVAQTTLAAAPINTAVPAATDPVATVSVATDVATTVAGPKPLPSVHVPADTYLIDEFSVPYIITTQGEWTRQAARKEIVTLGRGSNASTEFVVTSGLVTGSTPQEALDDWCSSGTINVGETSATTLLGAPAIVQEGTVTEDCNWAAIDTATQLVIRAGDTIRLVAADVDGTIVVVVVDSPNADWQTVSTDADAMIASMSLPA